MARLSHFYRERFCRQEAGSAVVEFTLVGVLLTMLTLGVLQLGFALLIRNTVHDAAAEGARWAALGDNTLEDGIERTQDILRTALGSGYADDVTAGFDTYLGHPSTIITVRTPLPLVGPWGISGGLEVRGHAAREYLTN